MHQVLRADEFTSLIEGQFTLVDIERVVALNHVLRRVRHHLAIGVDIERNTVSIGGLNQIIDLRNRTNTKRNIIEAKTRCPFTLIVESLPVVPVENVKLFVSLLYATDTPPMVSPVAGSTIWLIRVCRRFGKRGANIGSGRHLDDTADTVHRNVEDVIAILCRQLENIGQRLVRAGTNRLCRCGPETSARSQQEVILGLTDTKERVVAIADNRSIDVIWLGGSFSSRFRDGIAAHLNV